MREHVSLAVRKPVLVLHRINDNHLQHFEYYVINYLLDARRALRVQERLDMLKSLAMLRIYFLHNTEFFVSRIIPDYASLSRAVKGKLEFRRARKQLVAKILKTFQILPASPYIRLVGCKYYRL